MLLNLIYSGNSTIQTGDTLEWDFSILEGAAPVSLITIELVGPYGYAPRVAKNLGTPAGFGNETIITSGKLSLTIRDPWVNGTYNYSRVKLVTQGCPLRITRVMTPSWASDYAIMGEGVVLGEEGGTLGLEAFPEAFPLFPLVFGDGDAPDPIPPVLTYFANTSSLTVEAGDRLEWAYSAVQGSFPLRSITLQLSGPVLHAPVEGGPIPEEYGPANSLSFGPLSVTASVGGGGAGEGEGTVVSGTISVPVTDAWLEGEYRNPYLTLSTEAAPFRLESMYTPTGQVKKTGALDSGFIRSNS